jgi:hypothetical protein
MKEQKYLSKAKLYLCVCVCVCVCKREREREMSLHNRMSLRPGLLWLTLILALIIQCLSWNNIFFNITQALWDVAHLRL